MSQKISGPVGIGIIVVVAIVICVALYMKFFRQQTLDPKVIGESQAGIARTQDRLRKAGFNAAGPPHAGGTPNTAGGPDAAGAGAGK